MPVNIIATTFTLHNHSHFRGHHDSDHFVLFDICLGQSKVFYQLSIFSSLLLNNHLFQNI